MQKKEKRREQRSKKESVVVHIDKVIEYFLHYWDYLFDIFSFETSYVLYFTVMFASHSVFTPPLFSDDINDFFRSVERIRTKRNKKTVRDAIKILDTHTRAHLNEICSP